VRLLRDAGNFKRWGLIRGLQVIGWRVSMQGMVGSLFAFFASWLVM
jgi:hypothetical protein